MCIGNTTCKHDVWLDNLIKEYQEKKRQLDMVKRRLPRIIVRQDWGNTTTAYNDFEVITYS